MKIVLAEVDSEAITTRDLRQAYQMQQVIVDELPEVLTGEEEERLKEQVLESLITHRIFLIQARKEGLKIDAKVLRGHLQGLRQGYDEDSFEERLVHRGFTVHEWETIQQEKFLVRNWIRHKIVGPTQLQAKEIKEYYKKNADDFVRPKQVRALHILLDSREKADHILAKLEEGADFEDLARKYSTAPEAARGGDLGYFTQDAYPSVFTETCFKLKKGQRSSIIASEYGYHLFKLIDRKPKRKLSFDEVSSEIRQILTQRKVQENIEDTLRQLRDSMDIKRYPEAIRQVRLRREDIKG
jgi:parvulin-like peptidyl-prolyl isomerase